MAGKLGQDNQILEEDKIITEPIERVIYKDDVSMWNVQEGIRRARLRLDEASYKLFSNNCESLVNGALTGEDVTNQGRTAPVKIGVGATMGAGVLVIGVGILIAKLISDRFFSSSFSLVSQSTGSVIVEACAIITVLCVGVIEHFVIHPSS